MLGKISASKGIAALRCAPAKTLGAAATALLLCACSGTQPFTAGTPPDDQQQSLGSPAQHAAKPKRMRITSRDILAEWSTFGLEPRAFKRNRTQRAAQVREAIDTPTYSLTIEQIMASATCRSCEEKPYHRMVVNASNRHGVPAGLIHAVIQKESAYNPAAISPKRARGLMQITPETARFVGVRNSAHLYDPQTNINAGAAYLKYLMTSHDTVDEVLAAYNAGPGNVRKYNGVPPFSETRRYIQDVKKFFATTSRE